MYGMFETNFLTFFTYIFPCYVLRFSLSFNFVWKVFEVLQVSFLLLSMFRLNLKVFLKSYSMRSF